MNKDIITIYDDNNQKKDYKLLLVINNEYKYLIYTNIYNMDFRKDLYVVKTKSLTKSEDTIPINDEEWKMIEKTYSELIKA